MRAAAVGVLPWRTAPPEPVRAALRPWARRLAVESIGRWLIRGGIAALAVASLILLVGWVTPYPIRELGQLAQVAAYPIVLVALLIGAWPSTMLRRAVDLDTRLKMADRLASAWVARKEMHPMARLQRADALDQVAERAQHMHLHLPLRYERRELYALAGLIALTGFLYYAPSPMAGVLERQLAEQAEVQLVAERVEAIGQDPSIPASLTPEQARMLNELLEQARQELARAKTEQEALSILARTEEQLAAMNDPRASDLEEALAAMSETLTQEPMTRSLGEALGRNEPQGAEEAMQALGQQVDQLSDVQRQALSRALQRASNVGRSDPRSAAALREASRALAAGEPAEQALEEASAALREALQSATSQATLRSTTRRLQELRAEVASGAVQAPIDDPSTLGEASAAMPPTDMEGNPVAIEPGLARRGNPTVGEPGSQGEMQRSATGGAGATVLGADGRPLPGSVASENVFVPGRSSEGPSDQDIQQQPFTLRGQPRPYREVLAEYAQSGRDYVDRAAVSASVRDMVKQYFATLEAE